MDPGFETTRPRCEAMDPTLEGAQPVREAWLPTLEAWLLTLEAWSPTSEAKLRRFRVCRSWNYGSTISKHGFGRRKQALQSAGQAPEPGKMACKPGREASGVSGMRCTASAGAKSAARDICFVLHPLVPWVACAFASSPIGHQRLQVTPRDITYPRSPPSSLHSPMHSPQLNGG